LSWAALASPLIVSRWRLAGGSVAVAARRSVQL